MSSYLTTHDVEVMHHVLIERYGGALGLRDANLLEAAVFRPQSGYYADTLLQGAALFESLIINHPFIDGNKRIAFAAMDVFLRMNGYQLMVDSNRIYSKIMDLFKQKQMDIEHIHAWLLEISQTS
jgi:death-on-curing protein